MDLFIYLQVAPIEKIRFTHSIQNWVKKYYPNALCFDADNHSDDLVIGYGSEQIENAEEIVVLIESEPDQKLGGVITLVEKLIRKKKGPIIFFNGEHPMLEKVIRHTKGQLFSGLSEKEIIEQLK